MKAGIDYIGIAVGAIIKKDNKVLSIKRSCDPYKDYWALPGGKINLNETAEDAIKREIKEELGIKITPKFSFYNDSIDKRTGMHYLGLWFESMIDGGLGKIKLNPNEISEIEFFDLRELRSMDLGFCHNWVVEKYKSISNL